MSQLADSELLYTKRGAVINGTQSPQRLFFTRVRVYNPNEWWLPLVTFCGGVVINDSFVLTAAHCVMELSICDNVSVVDGIFTDGFPYTKEYAVDKIIIHENLNKSSGENDIALLKLNQKIPYNEEIQVCENRTFENYSLCVCGTGYINFTTKENPAVLYEVRLHEPADDTCDENENFS
ncbi:transmembrane protease serine 11B-like protein [Convolutriloba macropyga]|uniref:transmembrane protease serine 11B-like protein n=1 Tax=Convolutriloba macropyga TaxID=536237 RepID=UPI003F51F2C1